MTELGSNAERQLSNSRSSKPDSPEAAAKLSAHERQVASILKPFEHPAVLMDSVALLKFLPLESSAGIHVVPLSSSATMSVVEC